MPIEGSPCARHNSKCFTSINSLNFHNRPGAKMAIVPIFSGGNGGTELIRSGAGIQTHHPCSLSFLDSIASHICLAICMICWIVVLEEESNVNCLALPYSTASHACNRGTGRAFSFVISHYIPPQSSREDANPFATIQPAISDSLPFLFSFLPVFLFLKAQLVERKQSELMEFLPLTHLFSALSLYSKQLSFWELWIYVWVS